ncbi:MAG: DivIVA domain-containing protein [bacterium]
MEITPLDIRKQEFKKSFNGCDRHEVETFLTMVAEQMEEVLRENHSMKEQIDSLVLELERYKSLEKTLQDTLTSAQRSTSDMKTNSIKESEIIIRNAKLEAENIVQSAKNEVIHLKNDIKTLITLKNNFISRFRGIIDSYIKMLDQETNEHKIEVNEINQILKEPPENIMNLGALFNHIKKEEEKDGENKKISGILKE